MLKTLNEILIPLGISKAAYQQMRSQWANPPKYKEVRPNTRGRGAEYFYDEDEVVKAITDFRSRSKRGNQEANVLRSNMTMREKILDALSRHKLRRKQLQELLRAMSGSNKIDFDLTFDDLVDDQVIYQPDKFGSPGVYAIQGQTPFSDVMKEEMDKPQPPTEPNNQ